MSDLNILFATRNGEAVIGETLAAYRLQQAGAIRWRLIVVDNGSTDRTREIVREYQAHLPITLIEHDVPGKNRALNAALSTLDADLIVVSDDDAPPETGFLHAWHEAGRTHVGYDLFGGAIEPSFQAAPPAWMQESRFHYAEIFAARDLPEGPVVPTDIFGPNMAVRRRVFEAGLRFNEDIGPNGTNKNYPMGSETEFCRRVGEAGFRAWFVAGAKVRHLVRPHQITRDFWTGRAYRHGLGAARQLLAAGGTIPAGHALRHAIGQGVRRILAEIRPGALARQGHRWQYEWKRGFRDGLERD